MPSFPVSDEKDRVTEITEDSKVASQGVNVNDEYKETSEKKEIDNKDLQTKIQRWEEGRTGGTC